MFAFSLNLCYTNIYNREAVHIFVLLKDSEKIMEVSLLWHMEKSVQNKWKFSNI